MKEALNECFDKGLLKKIDKNKKFALQDLIQAKFFLNEAEDLIELDKKEMALIALYNAVFHSARAILFDEGVKEKSHYCMQKYLEEIASEGKQVTLDDVALFDSLRGIRQETQYGLVRIRIEEDLSELFNRTEEFLRKISKFISPKEQSE